MSSDIILFHMFSCINFRLKIENATLKESMESMEHLTSSIDRLRVALLKVILQCLHIVNIMFYL